VTLGLQLRLRVITVAVIFLRGLVGLAGEDGLADLVDGLESTLWVAETDGLRKLNIALDRRVSTGM